MSHAHTPDVCRRLILCEALDTADVTECNRLLSSFDTVRGTMASESEVSNLTTDSRWPLGLYLRRASGTMLIGAVDVHERNGSSCRHTCLGELLPDDDECLVRRICHSLQRQGKRVVNLNGFALREGYRTSRIAQHLIAVATAWAFHHRHADYIVCRPWPGIRHLFDRFGYRVFPGTRQPAQTISGAIPRGEILLGTWNYVPDNQRALLTNLAAECDGAALSMQHAVQTQRRAA